MTVSTVPDMPYVSDFNTVDDIPDFSDLRMIDS